MKNVNIGKLVKAMDSKTSKYSKKCDSKTWKDNRNEFEYRERAYKGKMNKRNRSFDINNFENYDNESTDYSKKPKKNVMVEDSVILNPRGLVFEDEGSGFSLFIEEVNSKINSYELEGINGKMNDGFLLYEMNGKLSKEFTEMAKDVLFYDYKIKKIETFNQKGHYEVNTYLVYEQDEDWVDWLHVNDVIYETGAILTTRKTKYGENIISCEKIYNVSDYLKQS